VVSRIATSGGDSTTTTTRRMGASSPGWAGPVKNTRQPNFDLVVRDLAADAPRTVAEDVRMPYGGVGRRRAVSLLVSERQTGRGGGGGGHRTSGRRQRPDRFTPSDRRDRARPVARGG